MSNDERNVIVIGNYFIALVSLHSFDHKKLENNAVSVCVFIFISSLSSINAVESTGKWGFKGL
jgi:hypothetical protein